jgi:diacylglycerol kinase (ATP)
VDVDGTTHEVEASLLAIANTAYFGGGMAVCPSATPTDGRLDVAVVGAVGRLRLLRFFPQVFSGRHVTNPAVTMWSATRLRIETIDDEPAATPDARDGVWGDGEPLGPLPIDIEVVPAALQVAGARTNITTP